MKNIFENIAVWLVIFLALVIVGLIVRYNMIEEYAPDKISFATESVTKSTSKQENPSDYLKNMENYADEDIDIDPTQEDTANKVVVKSEGEDKIDEAIKDTYVDKLENYADTNEEKEKELESIGDTEGDIELPVPNRNDIDDEIGAAIDDIVR